jgi:ATP sulfurylase
LQKVRFLNSLNNSNKILVDYANLKEGLFLNQKTFLDQNSLLRFCKYFYLGIPILFPVNSSFFYNSKKKNFFFFNNKKIRKCIYNSTDKNYQPLLNYKKNGDFFYKECKPKKKYLKIIKKICAFNFHSKNRIKILSKKFKKICAFQTRNIPHLGHEKIIINLLNKYDHVVINPIIGPKKIGDVRYDVLDKVYNFLIQKRYKEKVSYIPYISNMFYAGPREAVHHANIRASLGFRNFVIGRDHAGSGGFYKPMEAVNIAKKYQKHLPIKIQKVLGAYFCKKCEKVLIKNECSHNNLTDISGTEFRKCLKSKKYFKFANKDIQDFIFNLPIKLFVE